MKNLRRLWVWLVGCYAMALCCMPAVAMAKKAAANVVIVADTRQLTGLMHTWAQMYNDSHVLFMVMTVVIVPVLGCIFGLLADVVMKYTGIDLSHRDTAE